MAPHKPLQWPFDVSLGYPVAPIFFLQTLQSRTLGNNWCSFVYRPIPFLSLNQPCRSNEDQRN